MSRHRPLAAAAGLVLPVTLTGCSTPGSPSRTGPSAATPPTSTAQMSIADVAAQLAPSVVTVLTDNDTGSGVVYRTDGYITTNEHVVRGANAVTLAFADATQDPARVVAAGPISDIAPVQAQRRNLPAARFANALPRVGDTSVAIGSPLGLSNTVAAGIVSAPGRAIPGSANAGNQALVDLIQTATAISPGSSGVLVTAVAPNGPAAQAKITPGSVIQQLAGTPTPTVEDFLRVLRQHGPGQRVNVALIPAGQRSPRTVDLVLVDRPR